MYVCLCRTVTERTARKAVVRGARTVEDIGAACGAGTGCGGCWEALEELLPASARQLVSSASKNH